MGCQVATLPGLSMERSTVQTVTGPLPSSRLGVTLMHEHIVTDLRAPAQRHSGDYDPEEAFRVALPHLKELREAGCSSLVEITPMHIGRDVEVLRRLSKASGLNIVAATGIYGAADGKFVPGHADRETAEQLAERYVDEARQGVGTTGIRPGIIKTGVNGRTPLPALEKKLVRAAAWRTKRRDSRWPLIPVRVYRRWLNWTSLQGLACPPPSSFGCTPRTNETTKCTIRRLGQEHGSSSTV